VSEEIASLKMERDEIITALELEIRKLDNKVLLKDKYYSLILEQMSLS